MGSDHQPNCEELFRCTRCGECCKGFGGTYLTEADILAIARYLGISVQQMVDAYTCLSGSRRLIVQAANTDQKWVAPQTHSTGFFFAAAVFWIFCFGMSRYSMFMERQLDTGHKS